MSALRVHDSQGRPILIDEGPHPAHPLPHHVPGGALLVGQSGSEDRARAARKRLGYHRAYREAHAEEIRSNERARYARSRPEDWS